MLTTLMNYLTRLLDPPFPHCYRVTPRHNPWVFRRSLLRAIRTELRGKSVRSRSQNPDWSANLEGTTLRHHRA